MQDKTKVYTVIGLSIDDVIVIDDYYRDMKDNDDPDHYRKMYEHLNEEDREYLAQYIGDWLWDGDKFEDALQCGLHNLAAVKTSDGRTVKVEIEQ